MADPSPDTPLSRSAASEAVEAIGWRYLLGTLCRSVTVSGLQEASGVATAAVAACADQADQHLRLDLRPDRIELSLQDRATGAVTSRDVELAQKVSGALSSAAATTGATTSGTTPSGETANGETANGATAEGAIAGGAIAGALAGGRSARPVQMLEMAIDALDIDAVRPFWKAVMAYVDQPGGDGPERGIVDPAGQLPAIWFQPMDAPRPQRNRVHFDVAVPHDEADGRVRAALEAGGVMVNDSNARSFWVLADVEGNEACVCTWTDRDERGW